MLGLESACARVDEVSWVLDYLDDLESDFSVFHRVDDMYAMPGRRFLRLAVRTVAYRGVMRERAQGLQDAQEPQSPPVGQPPTPDAAGRVGARTEPIDATPAAVAQVPVLHGLIEFGGG